MKIDSLKDLEKMIKLCQKNGVEAIEVDGVKISLKEPVVHTKKHGPMDPLDHAKDTAANDLTAEELLMWSVGSFPSEGAASESN